MIAELVQGLGSNLDRTVVVVGAGGHAKVAIEALRFSGWTVLGCTDFNAGHEAVVGAPVLGTDDVLPEVLEAGVRFVFVALGNNKLREAKADELRALGFEQPNAIGPNAAISPSAQVGVGVAIFGGAIINADARIADYAIINTNASVDHDCVIGRAAHIAPGCALAGCVTVGDRTFVGAGSTVIPGITIGPGTLVGAGSVVVRDLAGGITALGVPARLRQTDVPPS
jgi:UDP-perosamine 4-acetyltransferase